MKLKIYSKPLIFAILLLISSCLNAADINLKPENILFTQLEKTLNKHYEETIKNWADNEIITSSIKSANQSNYNLSITDINNLNKKWMNELKNNYDSRPFIQEILLNDLSDYLRSVTKKNHFIYTEIIVMDNKGLNLGISKITSDYWQGDEKKWYLIFNNNLNKPLITHINFDESTKQIQANFSVPIIDKNTNVLIGVIHIGIDIEKLALYEGSLM